MPAASAPARNGSSPAKATPIARPSGRLCKAIANTNSQVRRSTRDDWPSTPLMKCSCGNQRSISSSAAAPIRMATAITPAACQLPAPAFFAAARPGRIREKEQAASITPAPNPNRMSCVRSEMRCENSTGSVPSAVASAAISPPCHASDTLGFAAR